MCSDNDMRVPIQTDLFNNIIYSKWVSLIFIFIFYEILNCKAGHQDWHFQQMWGVDITLRLKKPRFIVAVSN